MSFQLIWIYVFIILNYNHNTFFFIDMWSTYFEVPVFSVRCSSCLCFQSGMLYICSTTFVIYGECWKLFVYFVFIYLSLRWACDQKMHDLFGLFGFAFIWFKFNLLRFSLTCSNSVEVISILACNRKVEVSIYCYIGICLVYIFVCK